MMKYPLRIGDKVTIQQRSWDDEFDSIEVEVRLLKDGDGQYVGLKKPDDWVFNLQPDDYWTKEKIDEEILAGYEWILFEEEQIIDPEFDALHGWETISFVYSDLGITESAVEMEMDDLRLVPKSDLYEVTRCKCGYEMIQIFEAKRRGSMRYAAQQHIDSEFEKWRDPNNPRNVRN